jgi:hypothetical protein
VVITEGLLVYLGTPIVAAMAAELHRCPAVQRWVLEMIAPETQRQHLKARKPVLEPANAAWGFAPADGFAFIARQRMAPSVVPIVHRGGATPATRRDAPRATDSQPIANFTHVPSARGKMPRATEC